MLLWDKKTEGQLIFIGYLEMFESFVIPFWNYQSVLFLKGSYLEIGLAIGFNKFLCWCWNPGEWADFKKIFLQNSERQRDRETETKVATLSISVTTRMLNSEEYDVRRHGNSQMVVFFKEW